MPCITISCHLNTGRRLDVRKTFGSHALRLLDTWRAFNLLPVSGGVGSLLILLLLFLFGKFC